MACPQLQQIQTELTVLSYERRDLQEELSTASPREKPILAAQIRRLNRQITVKTQELNLCLAQNSPPLPPPLLRIIVLACQWQTVPAGMVIPAPIDNAVLQQMFSESPNFDWTLVDLFVQSTLRHVRFDPALVYDIGALPGTALINGPTPGSLHPQQNRSQVIEIALTTAQARNIAFAPNDRVVVFINPPPCDAGALSLRALLDQAAEHTYFAHEVGHILGYNHSFGSDLTGNQNIEYGDPYCIMSARTFGGSWPQAHGRPAGTTIPTGLPASMWDGSGPLASAAMTAHHFPNFNSLPNVVKISTDYHQNPQQVRLVALSEAAPTDPVLAQVDTGLQSFFVEYRAGTGWDRGLAEPVNPNPAVVIHRRKPSSGNIISYAGQIPLNEIRRPWAAADDHFQVEIIVPPAGSPSSVVVKIS